MSLSIIVFAKLMTAHTRYCDCDCGRLNNIVPTKLLVFGFAAEDEYLFYLTFVLRGHGRY